MAKRKLQARPLSDEELDALAQVTPEDIEAARLWWQQHAPEGYEQMLEAVITRGQIDGDTTTT